MNTNLRKHWIALGTVLTVTFTILGFFGREVYKKAPPIPERVVSSDGRTLYTSKDILDGQQVWQSIGGQQVGTIWGHGAYQAPDWSADWLHREATALLSVWSQKELGAPYEKLGAEAQGSLRERLKQTMRENGYDEASGTLRISAARADAIAQTAAHYLALFGTDPALDPLRRSYALTPNSIPDAGRRDKLMAFFFWTSWASAAERPGTGASYTNNWPHEQLVGNVPTTASVVWSIVSIILLLAGVGALVWYSAFRKAHEELPAPPKKDPFDGFQLTPSMKAVWKYCVVVIALLALQVTVGAATAHYTVEGDAFFGIPLAKYLPYAVTRTWHLQLGVFWIATAFLAAGLFLAPLVGGKEPKYQRLGVNALFVALCAVVFGSLGGEWASIKQLLDLDTGFWLGTQGYEYVDLGRAFQIALYAGLILWLVLMLRGLWPALTSKESTRPIVLLFTGSAAAIGLFYGSGLMYGARTHLSIMEYWRWWVVHLWVEGFMEVFATAAVAFIFSRLGLVRPESAARQTLFSTCIFLVGGIPGTFHHLYFAGTPVSIMAVGACFSALEVVPLVLIGLEAKETLSMSDRADWMNKYRWPIRFFVAVAFWNLVGAGLFGFLINPPVALYYMQGLNTSPVHGHASLFGVYGFLALGLVLVVLRRLRPEAVWNERALSWAFWGMNGGLALMILLSLLPVGLAQTWASIEHGLWFARSAEFLGQPAIQTLRWMRMVGDTVFLAGVASQVWFTIGVFRKARPQPALVGSAGGASIDTPALASSAVSRQAS